MVPRFITYYLLIKQRDNCSHNSHSPHKFWFFPLIKFLKSLTHNDKKWTVNFNVIHTDIILKKKNLSWFIKVFVWWLICMCIKWVKLWFVICIFESVFCGLWLILCFSFKVCITCFVKRMLLMCRLDNIYVVRLFGHQINVYMYVFVFSFILADFSVILYICFLILFTFKKRYFLYIFIFLISTFFSFSCYY